MDEHLAAEAAWAALVAELLVRPGISQGTMLRSSALRYQRTWFALRHADGLAVKVPAGVVEAAEPFAPGGQLLPEWVVVPDARHARWPDAARAALDHARRLSPLEGVG